jgi:hypothetical protein
MINECEMITDKALVRNEYSERGILFEMGSEWLLSQDSLMWGIRITWFITLALEASNERSNRSYPNINIRGG